MKSNVAIVLFAGVVIPVVLHVLAPAEMPWWPDTVSMGIGFAAFAMAVAWKIKADRETNRRLWIALRAWGAAIGRHFGSN